MSILRLLFKPGGTYPGSPLTLMRVRLAARRVLLEPFLSGFGSTDTKCHLLDHTTRLEGPLESSGIWKECSLPKLFTGG